MDEDILAAQDLGYKIYGNLISTATESVAWGAYLILFIFAMTVQFRRGPRNSANVLMLFVTIVMFCSSTVLWALSISWSLLRIHTTLVSGWDMSWQDRIAYNLQHELSPLGTPIEALFLMNMLLGDAVVVARARVVWGGHWQLPLIPAIFLLAALAFSVTSVICLELDGFDTATSTVSANSYVCRRAEPIAWALSILTNVIATSLIAYKAWLHRRLLNDTLGKHPVSRVQQILSLMVETGLIYILLLISQLVKFWEGLRAGNDAHIAYAVLAPLGDQMTGIYATAVIVLVALHKTRWNGSDDPSRPTDFLPELDSSYFMSNTTQGRLNPPQPRRMNHRRLGSHGSANSSITEIQFAPRTVVPANPTFSFDAGLPLSIELRRMSESDTHNSDVLGKELKDS